MTKTKKSALITGINGQDGSYLAELLLKKDYKVYGMFRRTSSNHMGNIVHLLDKIELIYADMTDMGSIMLALKKSKPDEVYNLAAQSFVSTSFEQPYVTGMVTGLGVTNMLEAIRYFNPKIKYYQASSSEMFGKISEMPQNEETRFHPRSPYAVAKLYGHWLTINYRESYDMYACSGILFNHESERRGLEFVTRKITDAVAKIYLGKQKYLYLGNLEAKRDWGHAQDYVEAMWLMLQQNKPDDYVIASGETHSVKDFVKEAFAVAGIKDWEKHIKIDKRFFRPAEVDILLGDCSKAKKQLGWEPKISFKQLVELMVKSDITKQKNKSISCGH